MITLALLLALAIGFAAGWYLRPRGDRQRGRCGAPLGHGRHCQGKVQPGGAWCWRHPGGLPRVRVKAHPAGAEPAPIDDGLGVETTAF